MDTYGKGYRTVNGAVRFIAALGVFLFTVCLFIGLFWWYGRDYARISLEKEYYFLVRDCEDTTASAVAGQVYLSGGAGYLYERSGHNSVVLACYFRETDAERVQSAMLEKGIDIRILALSGRDFSLSGKAAAFCGAIESNIETVETCAHILFDAANGLERAELSQEEARVAVRGVVKSLKGLRLGCGDDFFALWAHKLVEAERRGAELSEGILFAKDLRYLQVELCMDILHADEYFS